MSSKGADSPLLVLPEKSDPFPFIYDGTNLGDSTHIPMRGYSVDKIRVHTMVAVKVVIRAYQMSIKLLNLANKHLDDHLTGRLTWLNARHGKVCPVK